MAESLNLLLIEDNDDSAFLIQKSLERAQHRVTRCRTAAGALIVMQQQSFDLIILDQELPDMFGLDLLRQFERDGGGQPIIMVTGEGNEALAAEVLRLGALDYLVKDERMGFLVELPKRVLESVTRYRLERANGLLVQALESAGDGIMIVDRQGTIRTVNRALLALTGYERDELIGQAPQLLLGDSHSVEAWSNFPAGRGWRGEQPVRRKDGTPVPTSLSISPIEDRQNHTTHFVGILRDVTDHKKLERQLLQAQKMQSVGTLAGGIAHEFNNLLAGINGYAALALREQEIGGQVREFLENVVALSERAALLTRQLLAFARKPALSRQRTLIIDLVQATVELVRRTLHREVVLELSPADLAAPLVVEADGNQLQQALVNLAVNARDALRDREKLATPGTAPGPINNTICVRLHSELIVQERSGFPQHVPPGDYVLLQVIDTGIGMTADVLTQAVDPFFTTKEVGKGTGLGLPVVFGIVQAHHGFLQIDSIPGEGTTISIYLPRSTEAHQATPAPQDEEPTAIDSPSLPPSRILVIDDEDAVVDVVRRFLEIAGHRVLTATSGREAIEQHVGRRGFDLFILDMMIPQEDAVMTFQELRRLAPRVPVLLCTGLPEVDPAPRLLKAGAAALVRKPFRMKDLLEGVQQAIDSRR
jgi:PAS domain S-box-containing protein